MYSVIAINLAMGFIIPNVDWHAHLGGLIFGAASTAVLVAGPVRKWMGLRIVGICLLVLVALYLDSQRVTELQLLVGQYVIHRTYPHGEKYSGVIQVQIELVWGLLPAGGEGKADSDEDKSDDHIPILDPWNGVIRP
jgi:hypothetical protein